MRKIKFQWGKEYGVAENYFSEEKKILVTKAAFTTKYKSGASIFNVKSKYRHDQWSCGEILVSGETHWPGGCAFRCDFRHCSTSLKIKNRNFGKEYAPRQPFLDTALTSDVLMA